jgi:Flp pilus assembly protein TadG
MGKAMFRMRVTSHLSFLGRAQQLLKRFARADGGNIAITFALAILPVVMFVGAAVDYTRVNKARTEIQAAMDSTALMISKDATSLTQDQITSRAKGIFTALYQNPDAPNVDLQVAYTPNLATGGSSVQLTGSGSVQTDFLRVAGIPTIGFSVGSTSKWGNAKLRVALALDNTGSMSSDGKIGALLTASKNLINQLSALSKNPGDVFISISPFAKSVNVGTNNVNASWLKGWSAWEAEPSALVTAKPPNWANYGPGVPCPFTRANPYNFNCINGPQSNGTVDTSNAPTIPANGNICPGDDGTDYKNGCYHSQIVPGSTVVNPCAAGLSCKCTVDQNNVPTGGLSISGHDNGQIGICSCTGKGSSKSCTQSVSTYTHSAWIINNHSTWNGCVSDRTAPYNSQNDAPTNTATNFAVEQYMSCPAALVPLSENWSALKSKINSMVPAGQTNQPIGLAWAWQSLTQGLPLNPPAENPNFAYDKAIILLSDGLNTQDGLGNSPAQIDQVEANMCSKIKAAGITIYSVQVDTGTPGDPLSTVMQNCASSPDKFYLLRDATQLTATFNAIGTELSKLRIAM